MFTRASHISHVQVIYKTVDYIFCSVDATVSSLKIKKMNWALLKIALPATSTKWSVINVFKMKRDR